MSESESVSFFRRPKALAIVALVVVVAAVAALVVPRIPEQMRRGAALQAFAEGDYETAALDLESHMRLRPDDDEAGLHYALAALHSGEDDAARAAFARFASSPMAAGGDFLLGRALSRLDDPETAGPALNTLLSQNPDHPAARVARAVLRANAGNMRGARDDFLEADHLIRGLAEDDPNLQLVNRVLLAAFAADEFAAPDPAADFAAPVEGRLEFPLGADGFANRYALPGDGAFAREHPPQSAVSALHYANFLIREGQYPEAETELNQAEAVAPDLLMLRNLRAFLPLRRGDFAAAAEMFADIAEAAPDSPRAALNRANSAWAADPDIARWQSAAAAYDAVLEAEPDNPAALNNRAYLRILGGDLTGARADLDAVAADSVDDAMARKLRFNRAVADLAEGDHDAALDTLEKLAAVGFASAPRAAAAAARAAGRWDRAAAYRSAEPSREFALHLERRGLLMRALWALDSETAWDSGNSGDSGDSGDSGGNSGEDLSLFRRGRILAKLGNRDAALEQAERMSDPVGASALRAVVAAIGGERESALEQYRVSVVGGGGGGSAEYAESLGEWLSPRWPTAGDLAGLPLENAPRLAALAAAGLAGRDDDRARELAGFAAKLRPHDFLVLRRAGFALARAGEAEAGLEMLERAREGYPADAGLWKSIQDFRAATGDRDGALRAAETLVNLANPGATEDDDPPFKFRAFSKEDADAINRFLAARQYDKALAVHEKMLESPAARRREVRAALLYNQAALLRAAGRHRDSARALTELLDESALTPRRRAAALSARGKSLMMDGDRRGASESFEEAAELNPALAEYRRQAAAASSNPTRELEAVTRRFPLHRPAYLELADLHRERGELQRAVAVLERLARIAPRSAIIYKKLSEFQGAAGDAKAAAVNMEIHAALTPKN